MADRFVLIKFKKSNTQFKKYDAIIMDKITKRKQIIPFGDKRYEQYRDDTNLRLYTRLNHLDEKRRKNYLSRHAETMKKKWSPSYFAAKFLWAANI